MHAARLLVKLKAGGHRVLLFSQSTRMLDILQDFLAYRGMSYERLDGSVRSEERWTAVQHFQRSASLSRSASLNSTDGGAFVFLLSTRAGGMGLNLVSADVVILYDSDWNPQADLQAIGRAHRIGQTKPVRVFRLMTSNSVEEVIVRRALRKLQLTQHVVGGGVFAGQAAATGTDVADGDTPDGTTLLHMIQFGLSKLDVVDSTPSELRKLINDAVDVALAAPSASGLSRSSAVQVDDTTAWRADGSETALSATLGIDHVASQLQESLYEYEGQQYNPTTAEVRCVLMLDARVTGSELSL